MAKRRAFTLVELLVTMAVTLILIAAMAQAFAVIGDKVAAGRTTIEMSGNMRMAANQLQQDLQGITVAVRPAADDSSGGGYFEIFDGPSTDKDYDANGIYEIDEDRDGSGTADVQENPPPPDTTTHLGDVDDIVAFTTRSAKSPFIGQAYNSAAAGATVYQSTLAEVVWWIQYDDVNSDGLRDVTEPYLIHRRAMLIRPDLVSLPTRPLTVAGNNQGGNMVYTFPDGVTLTRNTSSGMIQAQYPNNATGLAALKTDLENFFNENDVSVRVIWQSGGNLTVRLMCNSLADLTRRESRYAHVTVLSDQPSISLPPVAASGNYAALPLPAFPFTMDTNRRSVTSLYRRAKHGSNRGEDVVVSDALAFDVQVFDPDAPVIASSVTAEALAPSDPGYFTSANSGAGPTLGYGTFVDLGYRSREPAFTLPSGTSFYSGAPNTRSQLNNAAAYTYCTWSNHYERNGVNEDGDALTDEGTNGFDDPTPANSTIYVHGVDDVTERETLPPYPDPLRGIQITLRAIDPDSRQVRQAAVVSDFVPE